jgi:hypothetical protein
MRLGRLDEIAVDGIWGDMGSASDVVQLIPASHRILNDMHIPPPGCTIMTELCPDPAPDHKPSDNWMHACDRCQPREE